MYLLTAVVNNESLLDELITGWLDIGITGATVVESTDAVQMISLHIPIFAGFRTLTGGGMHNNKMIFVAVEDQTLLEEAVAYLVSLCQETGKPHQGVYFVTPLAQFGRLGIAQAPAERERDMARKLGA